MAIGTRLALAALLLGAAAPTGLLAQDATTPAESGDAAGSDSAAAATATETASPEGEAAAASDAGAEDAAAPAEGAAPEPAQTAPAASASEASVGSFYIDATNGDWTIRCQKTDSGNDPCEIYQLMKDDHGNSVAEISMIPIEGQAAAGATLVAPLETALIPGIGLQIDSGKQQAYPFSFCAPVGCVSRIGFTQAEIDTMKKGNKATVTLMPYGAPQEDQVNLKLSLNGFTASWNALTAKPAPQAPAEAPQAEEAPAAQ